MELVKYRGKFAVYWRENDQPIRRSLGTSDPAEAERRFSEFKRTLDLRRREAGLTIRDLWEARKTALEGRRLASNMKWTEKVVLPHFGHLRASQVTEELVKDYIQSRSSKSSGTIHGELNHLRMTLNWAKKRQMIPDAPWIPLPTRSPPKTSYLTKDQVRAFLDACAFAHLRLFATLAIATGARRGALLDLKWSQVDLERRTIDLAGDTPLGYRKGRALVPINDTLLAALQEASASRTTDYVIEYASARVLSVSKGIKAAAVRAQVPFVSPHVFRHSAAVWMAESGIGMEEIAQYLGHSNPAITRRVYARFSPTYLRKAAGALEL